LIPTCTWKSLEGQERDDRAGERRERQARPPAETPEQSLRVAETAGPVFATTAGAGDPFVDADRRVRLRSRGDGRLLFGAHRAAGGSDLLEGSAAEQALRAQDHHRDQDPEHDQVRVRR